MLIELDRRGDKPLPAGDNAYIYNKDNLKSA